MTTTKTIRALHAAHARLPGAWTRDVRILVDAAGAIASVASGCDPSPDDERVDWLLPGMANTHSHAFQRAFAGLAERAAGPEDDFWTWRDAMYQQVASLDPDAIEAIAVQAYGEMLANGYTSVCEFHYVHHDPQGRRYGDPAELSRRLIAAAQRTGIALTLLPVLYHHGGFGRRELGPAQRRFAADADFVLEIVHALKSLEHPDLRIGAAAHSLRAVEPVEIRRLVNEAPGSGPLHIHAAEQLREVDECLAATGQRPVQLLLDSVGLDARWTIVHATHLDDTELRGLAASGATVSICPTTEANLGDGLFRFAEYAAAGGRWGIGSDSNICRDPLEELRLLEYGQRLAHRRRNFGPRPAGTQIAEWLWDSAAGGGGATGRHAGAISVGARADLVAVRNPDLDHDAGMGNEHGATPQLGSILFGGESWGIEWVAVGGRVVVRR